MKKMSENEPIEYERYRFDVVVIGAGGAGLRAAIAAREEGKTVAVMSKSLLGKAHTVMAEGGIAAAMGNVNSKDNWKVHFRDTMRGGKFLNNYRMAQLHAQEAPSCVWELESWGALFDRTKDGKVSQRNFGGHEYPRLAHVGDRTGLEMIRTLQQKVVSLQQEDYARSGDYEAGIKVFAECAVTDVLTHEEGDEPKVRGVLGYWRTTGEFLAIETGAVILATGGIGKSFKVTSNSWEYTGDGHAIALECGGSLTNMEFVQFHPTGMVWPPSVRGLLVTEGVRGDGGVLKNSEGERFMFSYIPEVFKKQYATSEEEADRWYEDPENNGRPPELLPRDEVARAINTEVKAGRGSEHGGVYLDVSTRLSEEEIKSKLPSMWHQFKELADVDITQEAMEVGPTCHYVMGGVLVDPDTTAVAGVSGLFCAGEAAGGLHGSNRLGGNSLSDLLVFGRRAGAAAARYAHLEGENGLVSEEEVHERVMELTRSLTREDGPSPYEVQAELQEVMNTLVGIIRTGSEMEEALSRISELEEKAKTISCTGGRGYNPGWNMAVDLPKQLLVSRCVALSALTREESRGGHTREDYPQMDPNWRRWTLSCELIEGELRVSKAALPAMTAELVSEFEAGELVKYMTEGELESMKVV